MTTTTTTTLLSTRTFEPRSIAGGTGTAARLDGRSQPQPAPPENAGPVSFNWQLEPDGVQDALERIYR
jgi:hypothetical protein